MYVNQCASVCNAGDGVLMYNILLATDLSMCGLRERALVVGEGNCQYDFILPIQIERRAHKSDNVNDFHYYIRRDEELTFQSNCCGVLLVTIVNRLNSGREI